MHEPRNKQKGISGSDLKLPDDLKFEDIFDLEVIQGLQDAFSDATGVASVITRPDGETITKPANLCNLCQKLSVETGGSRKKCSFFDTGINKDNTGAVTNKCDRCGLWYCGSGIYAGDKHLANWRIGQVIIKEEYNETEMLSFAKEIGADDKEFMDALSEVPEMSSQKFNKISKAFFDTVKHLTYLSVKNVRQKLYIEKLDDTKKLLQDTEKMYNLLVNASPDSITISDKLGNLLFVSDKVIHVYGYHSINEILGRNLLEFIHPEHVEKAINNIQLISSGEQSGSNEYKLLKKDGSWFWGEINSAAITGDDGTSKGMISITRDITDRKISDQNLINSERQYRQLFETLLDGFALHEIICDEKGKPVDYKFLEVNKSFEEITGLKAENIIGKNILEIMPNIERYWIEDYGRVALSRNTIKFENYTRELEKYFEVVAYSPERGKFATVFRDITEIKRNEKRLIESEEYLRQIIIQSPYAMMIYNDKWNLEFVNDKFTSLTGYTNKEILNIENWHKLAYPDEDYREKVAEDWQNSYSDLIEKAQITDDKEFIVTCKDGSTKNIQHRLGRIAGKVIIVLNDLSFIRKAESEREKLIKSLEAKNAEMERFTYTASHDLRSPLITIKGFLGLLTEDMEENNTEAVNEDIERIGYAADQMQNLLDDLLELSRIGRLVNKPEAIDIKEIIDKNIKLLQVNIKNKDAEIITEDNYPAVLGDKKRIEEVFQNLIENSLKFNVDGVKPVIHISYESSNDKFIFYVKDNGIGIDKKYYDKVFGLFNKLDTNTEGTGVGLALVKRIIELHNGKIWIESGGKNKGTTVFLTLQGI